MKKKTWIIIGIVIIALIGAGAMMKHYTKSHSPVKVAKYTRPADGAAIEVVYCQPYKKGRLIFGDESAGALQPYGKYWRVGANEATTFDVNKDIMVNGQALKAGKYQVYAIPGKDIWQIVFNSDWDRWGATDADHSKDVLKTDVPAHNDAPEAEQLEITFDNADSTAVNMLIHWDKTEVAVPISAN